jgi:hypothetical protein
MMSATSAGTEESGVASAAASSLTEEKSKKQSLQPTYPASQISVTKTL